MPIYEYQCESCTHKFETIQKVSDSPLVTCPECKEDKLRKLLTAAAFRLKGTGWYATDFKDKKPPQQPDKIKEKSKQDGETKDTKTPETKNHNAPTRETGKKPSDTKDKSTQPIINRPD